MFNQNIKRIGFACKVQISESKADPKLNQSGTTIKWLSSQTPDRARERLWDLMRSNVQALAAQIEWLGKQPQELRMFRITSDLLTAYTHDDYMPFYFQPDVVQFLESNLSKIGDRARELDIRLSFHPGQFCVLASEQDHVIENSITEFEYHCDLIRWMGFGQQWQDFKCNVHISGRRGPAGIIDVLPRLSPEARNSITIENDENSWGIDASLELEKHVALVLDLHHHWCHSEGEYIEPNDTRVARIIDSWRGVRPVLHYSVSREEYLHNHATGSRPDYTSLLESGHKKAKLRAHSDYYWNTAVNEWALGFWDNFDIMCESKMKNLASIPLHTYAKTINL